MGNIFQPENLTAKGQGKNYGMDAYIEKRFYSDFYFMVSGAVYESLFKNPAGKYTDTRFMETSPVVSLNR